eukprot:scaffold5190_cov113-Isochrysis_galbana.AAC.5
MNGVVDSAEGPRCLADALGVQSGCIAHRGVEETLERGVHRAICTQLAPGLQQLRQSMEAVGGSGAAQFPRSRQRDGGDDITHSRGPPEAAAIDATFALGGRKEACRTAG